MDTIKARLATAVLTSFLAAACAPHQQLSAEQRQQLRSVAVATDVSLPELPSVAGKGMAGGMLILGPIGGLIGKGVSDEPLLLRDHLQANNIDIKEILREEFLKQCAQAQTFPVVVKEGGDATVHLAIEDYGLALGFSMAPVNKPLSPTLRVTARMLAPDGKVLWEKNHTLTALSRETEAHKFDEYLANPDLTDSGFKKAAQVVVASLLEEFSRLRTP